jgi:predicted nucleic acid-binding protein
MSELVVDSCVAIKWFVTEPHSATAIRILKAYENNALALLAPDLIYAEFGNIVWKKRIFQSFDAQLAADSLIKFRQVNFVLTASADLLEDAYQLAVAHHWAVYDTLYLALSLRADCQFVTADERLVNAIGAKFSNIIWLANWP